MQLSYYMNSLKSSMLSGCDLHCLDKIEPLRLTIRANIFRTRKIFPVSNADALTGFLALCPPPIYKVETKAAQHGTRAQEDNAE